MSRETKNKQKRTRLSYAEKLEIIRLLDDGVDKKTVAERFNISASTIRATLIRRKKVEEANKQYELTNKKSSKSSEIPLIESAVRTWFYQAREFGDVISGPIICDKAVEFWNSFIANGAISNSTRKKFSASEGWLQKFKQRHGIRKLNTKGEILSSDQSSVEPFRTELKNKIEKDGIHSQNLYNADESGINYRSLTRTTLASHLESSAGGSKQTKERFTALFCSNANGSHKLRLFCIGDSMKPRDIKGKNLPVIYKGQKGAWMNRDIFLEWYKFTFIPDVKQHQRNTGIGGKVLLLLDNAPCHPGRDVLNAVDPDFHVMYLPPNTTAIIHPCDQGLISITKKKYRRKLLGRLHKEKGNKKRIIDILKNITLYQSFQLLSAAWDEVESSTLTNVWKPLLGPMVGVINDSNDVDTTLDTSANEEADTAFIRELVGHVMPEQDVDPQITLEISEWFNKDYGDFGWQQQTCDEIVAVLTQENKENFQSVGYQNMSDDSEQSFED